jgi:hypothetical protein
MKIGDKKMKKKISIICVTIMMLTTCLSIKAVSKNISDLSNITISEGSGEDYAMIIVGTNPLKEVEYGLVERSFYLCGRQVYDALISNGYDDDHICYLDNLLLRNEFQAETIDHTGMDGVCSPGTIENKIKNWLKPKSTEGSNVFMFFINHGNSDGYFIAGTSQTANYIHGSDVNHWLEGVKYNTLSIICEFCYSGAFIAPLSKENRIICTATDSANPAWANYLEGSLFISNFIDKLENHKSVLYAWEHADLVVSRKSISDEQNPQIDDNGDGIGYGSNSADNLNPQKEGDEGWLASKTVLRRNEDNLPPTKPTIEKIADGYLIKSIDPDGDQIYYLFDWGDDKFSEWEGPYDFGRQCTVENKPERVKARDEHGAESEWSDSLSLSMPKNKLLTRGLVQLLERHPLIEQFLKRVLKL